MNSAALHSAKLIAEFEKQQEEQQEPIPKYPSEHPFGAKRAGPFGGASANAQIDDLTCASGRSTHGDAFASDNEMSNFADWDAGYAAAPANATTELTHCSEAGPSNHTSYRPRPLTQYDYPGGWGAQTFSGVGGLTQDSASRIATLQAKLNQRLGPEYLSQRPGPGGGKKLTYIEGWKLVDLANEVFGFNGWSTTIVRLDVDFLDCSPDGTRFNAGVSCVVRVTLRDGAFHEDIGYGSAENARQKHAALEKGKKEAVTDATKRALKNFGKLLGNCTYDHQYSANALKVSNPPPKFDASELHRRPELRPAPMPAPQPPPPVPSVPIRAPAPPQTNAAARPAQPQPAQTAAQPASRSNDAAASHVGSTAPAQPSPTTAAPQQSGMTNGVSASTRPVNGINAVRGDNQEAEKSEGPKDPVSERQQRSMLARRAYLERQQAESRKAGVAETHQVVTSTNGAQRQAADTDFGSDSFDDGLTDVLADYDETSMGDAEAASHALEMEIDEAQRQRSSGDHDDSGDTSTLHPNHNAADDSGVAFTSPGNSVLVKQEKVKALEMRRSTSPVKQVKMEAAAPRRAGSVGRFISPPPPPAVSAAAAVFNGGVTSAGGYTSGANLLRNGTTSLSAAAVGAAATRNPPSRRIASTTLNGIGGVEGAANGATGAGRATGEPVNHAYVAGDAQRGIKRPNDVFGGGAENGRSLPRQSTAATAGGNAAAR
nr:DNA repair and recombination protein [Pseudozyma pruni]